MPKYQQPQQPQQPSGEVVAESNHFIVLNEYTSVRQLREPMVGYQSEQMLEEELIKQLAELGYEYLPSVNTPEALLANARKQIERLNGLTFSDSEWERFVMNFLDKPSCPVIEQTQRVHHNHICDFIRDDGTLRNVCIVDKVNIQRNHVQVIHQMKQTGTAANRYDVTILVNGLPMVQVELKRRGVSIREAFYQVHRYSKESFNAERSLFKYLQLFVISNGTDTRYFANTTKRDKDSFDFTMHWALADNTPIKDLSDFTATFFQKTTLLEVLLRYTVLDVANNLLIMRPYQIAATERILWKVRSAYEGKMKSGPETGGYVWHTTGSGKTLTSFKAARLATALNFVEKVFFVVDRKDLDYQTMKEYQRFQKDCVNGSADTKALLDNLEKEDNKIVVTTLQKLNNLLKSNRQLPIYKKRVVFIFDECHRSQFGEAQKNLQQRFSEYSQFGFTGTPILTENAVPGGMTTEAVFGTCLHSYKITDAIRDEKVLKFKVDYNSVRPHLSAQTKARHAAKQELVSVSDNFVAAAEQEHDMEKLSSYEMQLALNHPERIARIVAYILEHFNQKTHRNAPGAMGFNAMFAVSSVKAAQLYYNEFQHQMTELGRRLKVATIFSFAPNEAQTAQGEISDETFSPTAMDASAKEFLTNAMGDYNKTFGTSFTIEGEGFQNYYRDLCRRLKMRSLKERDERVDLVIVVGMLLTGFDAPGMNTLFVDKNLRYHGLIQAFSRTNRILDATKSFGNIVCFRDLEQPTKDALRLFGRNEKNDPVVEVIERSYEDFLRGYDDENTGRHHKGYVEVVTELQGQFPNPADITSEQEKRCFAKLFGQLLRLDNVLQSYDEFKQLREVHAAVASGEAVQVAACQEKYQLSVVEVAQLAQIPMMTQREVQDAVSTYQEIREWIRKEEDDNKKAQLEYDWNDVVFEVDLLKSQEVNLDYILSLIYDHHRTHGDKVALLEEVRRILRSSVGNRAKEPLIVSFIEDTDLSALSDRAELMEAFYDFAAKHREAEQKILINEEHLKPEATRRYLDFSLRRGYASQNGTDFANLFQERLSPLNPKALTRSKEVFARVAAFVEKYAGI